MKRQNPLLLRGVKQLNLGAIVSGVGFLLYLGAAALGWRDAADVLSLAFALASLYVFASVAAERKRDRAAVSCNLLWGQGALALLTCLCAAVTLRERLGR